jgi:DNA repair protein RecO (recombination protein O)
MRVHQQPAYVLLNRPYSETSWIVEVFSRDYGRLALIAKGARRFKSRLSGVLLPFQPLLVSWSGKGEVPTLTAAEIQSQAINLFDSELRGDPLVCGFYCNELVTYLLHRHDPHPQLFDQYSAIILGLYGQENADFDIRLSGILRRFEQIIIREAGYAVDFTHEADGKTAIASDKTYQYISGQGFLSCHAGHSSAVSGRVILTMQVGQKGAEIPLSAADLSAGKHLMRAILKQTLGYRNINSRELFFLKKPQVHLDRSSHY